MMAATSQRDVVRSQEFLETIFGDRFVDGFDIRFWDGTLIPSRTAQRAFTLCINAPAALRAAFSPPIDLNAGRAFVEGALDIEGNVEAAVSAMNIANDARTAAQTVRLAFLLSRLPRPASHNGRALEAHLAGAAHSKDRDRAAISYHYDHPVEFYESFLDPQIVYSCAYYDDGLTSLAQAQTAKIEHVLRKLRLKAGMSFLDIGCGWGSLVLAAARLGARATGITLSRVQYETAQRRIDEEGLRERANVELLDYRELGARRFDRIASIGMVEHVGRKNLPTYFKTAFDALRPGGLFLNHGIAEQSPGRTGGRQGGFINRYVFPDGELVAIGESLAVAERDGFEVRDVENLREHYARTLRDWVANLERNAERAQAIAGIAAYRVWRLYMSASASAFASGTIGIYQSLLARPDAEGRVDIPSTRRDLYA
ncbi:MAG TPA: cyclopropane-fatty-acyl-phospholipid synthase family protein [Candidatus Baltobacteraceae bacterium]|jgi:cyclopropane-fatty-acyl-phospholipid synthase|nr:cyclopropane-fatty-acyl-phospholipid synthase family protein [Candidatus Baltobacteraceae bacterium]